MLKHKNSCPVNLMTIQHTMLEENGKIRTLYRVYCPNCGRHARISQELASEIFQQQHPNGEPSNVTTEAV